MSIYYSLTNLVVKDYDGTVKNELTAAEKELALIRNYYSRLLRKFEETLLRNKS